MSGNRSAGKRFTAESAKIAEKRNIPNGTEGVVRGVSRVDATRQWDRPEFPAAVRGRKKRDYTFLCVLRDLRGEGYWN